MSSTGPVDDRGPSDRDQSTVHQFIRLFGHRPSPVELAAYERARADIQGRRPVRLRMARLITRL